MSDFLSFSFFILDMWAAQTQRGGWSGSLAAVRRLAEVEPMRGSHTEGAQCNALTCDSHAPAVFAFLYGFQDLVGTAHKALGTALRTHAVTRKHSV